MSLLTLKAVTYGAIIDPTMKYKTSGVNKPKSGRIYLFFGSI